MTPIVHTEGGRMVDLDAYIHGQTVGVLAEAIASDTYNDGRPFDNGAIFSFKIDGTVVHPDTPEAVEDFTDGMVIELVDVTNHEIVTAPQNGEPISAGDTISVPNGTVHELIAWVGDDSGRAEAVLIIERAADEPRKTLIADLEPIAARGADHTA